MKHGVTCLVAVLLFASVAVASGGAAERYAKSCKSCHGADGSNAAMSRALKGMSAEEVKSALLGYKAQSYGGKKKAMMERVSKPLSDAEIETLSAYIAGF
ncbi:MAG: cytochrome c [Geoalkalibacter sp.]|jgi:cytochrome c|uniref:c-type cytochrome n=1 Tax=Geoalkalibacter sp. TaxID=3041440 RepID=UPI003D0DC66B